MADEIVHYNDGEGENLFHLVCKRHWISRKAFTPPEKRALNLHLCSDGTYMTTTPELVTCPSCKAKLN